MATGKLDIVSRPAASIDDVLERMAVIEEALSPDDGVAHFNRMYRGVTEEVRDATRQEVFEREEFLSRLDVVFANLFFQAVDGSVRGTEISPAWVPLFASRDRSAIHPIQFALAGMNAHINHDLPLAVVATCHDLSLEPKDQSPPHRDFMRVNTILGEAEGKVKISFAKGLVGVLDDLMGRIDDAFAMVSIDAARHLAWQHAQNLWALEDHPHLRAGYLATLTGLVRFAGNGILI